jgi:hypothetical protein
VRVQVLRDACCAQDDQLGPLEANFEVPQGATIGDLVSIMVESRFLQYSSSHTSMVGFVGEKPFVRVFSSYYAPNRGPEFVSPATELATTVLGNQPIEFRFVSGV